MDQERKETATQMLQAIDAAGDRAAASLFSLVYDELRHLAARFLRSERADHTLQPTDLVHEAYLRLVDASTARYKDRAHFLAVAAKALRRMLVDHARKHRAAKRGGGKVKITLSEALIGRPGAELEMLALHEALEKLERKDKRASRVVELRFFGGLTIEEASLVLSVSRSTIEEDWALAKAWLSRELAAGRESP